VRVSIIVPALDEVRGIAATLAPLQPLRAEGHQVIVVDGGSCDGTLALASHFADRAFVGKRGRAVQMNAGAATASGDVLVFLHADSQLQPSAIATLLRDMQRSRRRWGRFDVTIAGRSGTLRVVAAAMNARSRATGIATGDQAMFVERALFESVGGFREQPLMEDIDLSKRLKRAAGAPLCLRERVSTSGRRWESRGVWRTIAAMWRLRFAYWRGADPKRLAAQYWIEREQARVVLQIFAKRPIAGSVKTRLATTVGEATAAALHARFVERTIATAVAARTAGLVDEIELWCAPDADAPEFVEWGDRHRLVLRAQSGTDLGERMRCALDTALARKARPILVGTDCPVLDVPYLAQAVAALETCDAVFGPAEDGGYVLVGLAKSVDAFTAVPWSVPETMAATRARLESLGVVWCELPTLWDVDEPRDLARWQALDAEPQGAAAAAHR